MTVSEFKAWLTGYVIDRSYPDVNMIVEKAMGIDEPVKPTSSRPFEPSRDDDR